jgi:hypothetical protein
MMLGKDIDLLRWMHGRLKSGNFSLDNAHDKKAVERLGKIIIGLEAERAQVPGPSSIPRHPFRKDWA